MGIFDFAKKIWHAVTGTPSSDEKRKQAKMVQEQIKAYRDQTRLAEEQLRTAQAAKDAEKRRIDEKQIRALRSHYRPASGFLNQGGKAPSQITPAPAAAQGVSNKLGV